MTPRSIRSTGLFAAFVCALGTGAFAQEEFYAGKTVTVTIGFSTGGNYDFVGRLVSRHVVKQLPGRPASVAVNMPGAGSIRAANYMFNAAPKDGTALGVMSSRWPSRKRSARPGSSTRPPNSAGSAGSA